MKSAFNNPVSKQNLVARELAQLTPYELGLQRQAPTTEQTITAASGERTLQEAFMRAAVKPGLAKFIRAQFDKPNA